MRYTIIDMFILKYENNIVPKQKGTTEFELVMSLEETAQYMQPA